MADADKRTVTTDALETLGTIIDDKQGRDAIHLAVENVVAGEKLYPGQDVGLAPNGSAWSSGAFKKVGIVDPFIAGPVFPGQRFWLVVYPRKITSLRHVWTHPDIPDRVETPSPALYDGSMNVHVDVDKARKDQKASSEKWMREWAVRHMGYDYCGSSDGNLSEEKAFENAIEAGRENSVGPYESARDYIDDEWWNHWEAITGEKGERGEYFSCEC